MLSLTGRINCKNNYTLLYQVIVDDLVQRDS